MEKTEIDNKLLLEQLKEIQKSCSTSTKKFHKCPHCDFQSYKLTTIHVHIDSKHPDHKKKSVFCDHCSKSFIFPASLTKHLENIKTMARERDKKGIVEKKSLPETAQNQIIKSKPPVITVEKNEQKDIKEQGSQPNANSKCKSEGTTRQERNQNIKYSYENSQFFCNECGDQSPDFNWFAKHVAEHKTEQMVIGKDPLKIVKVEDCITSNPWAGKDFSAFIKYCCPECEFNNDDLQLFSQHAFENYTNAIALFSKDVANEVRTDVKIEPLEDNYFLEISDAKENLDIDSTEKPIKKSKIKTKQESTIKEQVLCEICPVLDVKTSSLKSIKSHRTKNHKKGKQFCCPYCDTKDIFWLTLLRHVSLNHQEHYEKKFFCNICDKGFLFSSLYTKHKNIAHLEKEKIHICDICGNHYTEMYRLQKHIPSKDISEGATKLFCEKCGYSTVSKIILRKHMYQKHNMEKHKKCQFCEYTSPYNLKLHIHIDNNHPEKEEKNFLCEKCNRSFIYEASYTNHIKYKCKYSDYSKKQKEQKTKNDMKATKNKLFQGDLKVQCDNGAL